MPCHGKWKPNTVLEEFIWIFVMGLATVWVGIVYLYEWIFKRR